MTAQSSSTTASTLLAVLLLCSFSSLAHPESLSLISDKLAIAEMLTQYSYRWDGKDSAGFAELFSEDAVMERWREGSLVENSRLTGKQAILRYAIQSHQGRLADRQTRHHFSGLIFLEIGDDSATTENMALITHQTADSGPAFIASSGIYRNSWTKTPQGWRISKRILLVDSFSGNKSE